VLGIGWNLTSILLFGVVFGEKKTASLHGTPFYRCKTVVMVGG
jgi:hypothetical protein